MTQSPAVALSYGQRLIAEAIEAHFGERTDDYDEDVDDTSNHAAWEAFDALTARASIAPATSAVGEDVRCAVCGVSFAAHGATGWVLAPAIMTEDMRRAAENAAFMWPLDYARHYKAALAALTTQVPSGGERP